MDKHNAILTVLVTPELAAKIKIEAAKQDKKVSVMLREILQEIFQD